MATLTYIFQAAMGQCSTLPTSDGERLRDNGRKESLDFSNIEHRDPAQEPERMQGVSPYRESASTSIPDAAVRTRCYKLNLDCEVKGSSLGPFAETQPFLTYSSSTDDSMGSPTSVAIQTAQIFRGIRVDNSGTIVSQNARATRSSRGKLNKRGEKSRQAAKIDKAVNGESTQMVSLVPVGEYDDMKQLVRDGSRKLREAAGLSDSALLVLNRHRKNHHNHYQQHQQQPAYTSSSSRPIKQHPRDQHSKRKTKNMTTDDEDFSWNIWNCGVETRTIQRRVG